MVVHKCNKEAEIGQIQANLEIIKNVVMGNGKEGLSTTVPVLCEQVRDLREEMKEDRQTRDELKTAVRGLLKYENEQKAKEDAIDKRINKRIMLYMAIVATVSLGISLLINLV